MALFLKKKPKLTDEESILDFAQKGEDEKAFRLLCSIYQERLYWHIRKMVSNHDDTNDILQNTLIKVYKSIGKFKGDSKLYTWLYRIASNEAITFINKKKKNSTIEFDAGNNQLVADSYHDELKTMALLKKALTILPEKQKQVFEMRYFEELPYKEISELLDTSIGGLKASYHHAAQKIENFLKNH